MSNTDKFSGKAQHYDVGRPSYAPELIDLFYSHYHLTPQSVIADIGSGTGKFTEQLLKKGSYVYAVEPNEDMRTVAATKLHQYNRVKIINGSDAATTLADESVDGITVAQAFHWFDPTAFKSECRRILKKDGTVFLIWNMRDEDAPINEETYTIFKQYCPNFYGFSGGVQKDNRAISAFFNEQYVVEKRPNPLYYSKETFLQRCLSASYALKEEDANYEEFINALGRLFETFAVDGVVEVPNDSVAYIGKLFDIT